MYLNLSDKFDKYIRRPVHASSKTVSYYKLKNIKVSITLSMCINFAAIILSLMGVLTPTSGALVHNAGSCFVVLIAALLYDRKFE